MKNDTASTTESNVIA